MHHSQVRSPHYAGDVHSWHCKKGWAGIGYHFFIRKNGEIYQGRPIEMIGAHVYGHNDKSIGICYEGDFNKEMMPESQLNASVMLLGLLSLHYGDIPLVPHRALSKKATCPGRLFPMDELTRRVEECKKQLLALFGNPVADFDYSKLISLL